MRSRRARSRPIGSHSSAVRATGALALLAAGVTLGGCDWFSTMSRTDAIQPYESAPLPPPEGSVPLDGLPAFDLTTVEGLLTNPFPADSVSRARGEALFLTYCAVCHGADGLGKGPVAAKFPAVPPVAGAVRFSDAYLFGLITQGRGLMPAYGRIPRTARWDIVNHLRVMFPTPAGAAGRPDTAAAGPTPAAAAPDTTTARQAPPAAAAPDTGAAAP